MWNTQASLRFLIWQDLSIFKTLKRLWEQELSNTITAPQHRVCTAPEEIKWGCHQVSRSGSHTQTSQEETVSAVEFEESLPHMWNSKTPPQKNRELVQLSALTFQLNSPTLTPLPSSVPQAAAALTEGLCQFPSDCHSHLCLYYQRCTGAVPLGRAADLYLSTPGWPCLEPD